MILLLKFYTHIYQNLFYNINHLTGFLASSDGGFKGCVNKNELTEPGLVKSFEVLELVYYRLQLARAGVSRADFWALAAAVALERSSPR